MPNELLRLGKNYQRGLAYALAEADVELAEALADPDLEIKGEDKDGDRGYAERRVKHCLRTVAAIEKLMERSGAL